MVFENYKPKVVKKGNITEDFDEKIIVESLISETDADLETAEIIALEVKRNIFLSKIKFVSSPMLREIVNSTIIKHCAKMKNKQKDLYEIVRLKNTRIGIPRNDLKELLKKEPYKKYDMYKRGYVINNKLKDIIFNLVITEFYAVEDIIRKKEMELISEQRKNKK